MLLLVSLTGGAGFLCSFLLLNLGIDNMPLRYMISVAGAYLAFLLLLWLWLRTKAEDYDGAEELIDLLPEGNPRTEGAVWEGGGGRFGGAGATGSYDDVPAQYTQSSELVEADFGDGASESLKQVASSADSADEFAIPLFLVVLVGAILLASVSVVYSAPILFAELLLDGVLAATLYRRLKKLETRHWLQTALRRTVGPFVVVAIILGLAGVAMSEYAPGARSLGEVISHSGD
jgi:hypothetical protein